MSRFTYSPPRPFAAFIVALAILSFLLTCCAGTKAQREAERYYKEYSKTHPSDTARTRLGHTDVENPHIASPPDPLPRGEGVPKPGLFSGIGSLFSTPEGTAHRRAKQLAKAAVPRSIGKGAVYAPVATEVVNAYKTKQAVVNADSGAVVTTTSIGKNKASAATAPGATATTTIEKPGFWATVAGGLSWWWLLIPAGYAVYRFRKSIPFIG